jgi:dTDP-4-amino-4,6-dideoxygalactose transaminase
MNVPLSYNPINPDSLSRILKSYAGRHHEEIVRDLEWKLSAVTGSPNVLAVSSGTSAMHLALQVAGVRPGDYVIAPTFAYVASISPAAYLGAKLLFVDSEPETWNIDPALVREALEKLARERKRAAAIVVVHNFGMPAQMDQLVSIAREFDVPIVEDAAESFGSTWRGKWTGTIGDVGIYSFNSNKTITGFGGGALVSSKKDWVEKARYLAAHARSEFPFYQHEELGYNYRMSPLTAACVLSQLETSEALMNPRRVVNASYRSLGGKMGLIFQSVPAEAVFQPWLPACLLPVGNDAGEALERLTINGIEGRRLWKPMHQQPAFQGFEIIGGAISARFFDTGICLPAGSSSGSPPDIRAVLDSVLRH